jgi:hypothetical protein
MPIADPPRKRAKVAHLVELLDLDHEIVIPETVKFSESNSHSV